MRTSRFKSARPERIEAGTAYQARFFPALKSEIIWRLPFLYILYVVILGLLFFSQDSRDPFHVLIPLVGTLLILSMQFMLSRGANTKRLYDLLYLTCGATAVLPAGMLFSQKFAAPLLALVFLAQLACWVIFPWNFLRSMSWAILLLMYWSIVIFVHGFSLILMVAIVPILVLAVVTSRTNYQGWNLIQSSILLSKLGGEIQDTKNFVIIYTQILLHALDARHALLLKENGDVNLIGPVTVGKPQGNTLTAKSLYTAIKDQRKKNGNWKNSKGNIPLKAFFFDCLGKHYSSYNYSFVAILHDKDESEAIFLLPVEHFVDRIGFYRFYKTLQGLSDIYNLALMTQRNQVMSNDTVSTYGKELVQLEAEVNQIVHLVNNNAQEIAINCESLKEKTTHIVPDPSGVNEIIIQIGQVEESLRSLTQSVSDVKLLREISSLRSFARREQVSALDVIEDCRKFFERSIVSKQINFLLETENFNDLDGISVPSAEYLKAVLRALAKTAVKRAERKGSLRLRIKKEEDLIVFEFSDNSQNSLEEDSNIKVASLFAGFSDGKLDLWTGGREFAHSIRLSLVVCKIEKRVFRSTSNWILLVDDNPQVVGFYAHIAEALGMRYEMADSYGSAIEILNKQGRPKLVITDIQLTNSSGLDLVLDLRAKYGIDLPIIVVSGNDEQEIADKVYSSGASKYLKKPLGRKKLFSEIESLLK